MNKFAERLRMLRLEKKINQSKLGRYLNYGYTAIANYENGRNEPSIDTLIKIANCLEVSVDYLVGNDDEENKVFKLTVQEEELLFRYRRMNYEGKRALSDLLKAVQG